MKRKIFPGAIILLLFAVIALAALAQKDKENKGHNKEQGHNGKGNGNGNNGKGGDKGNGHGNKENNGNKKDNNGKHGDNDNQGNDDHGNGKGHGKDHDKMKDGYVWNFETFKDRSSIRKNMNKVTICHKPGKNNEPGVTISVSENALKAHMNHGDVMGNCPAVNNGVFSDIFIRRRTDYYTTLQNGQEQVLYSRSILDYALERLTGARSQLVVLQQNNAPAADIERKRLAIVELEQNTSLLQTLVGVAANLIAAKLMN